MDRLSRSLLDFAGIMQRAQKEGWALLALDSPADLTTPTGEAMAGVLAVFAQLERRLIGERTRAALAQRRSEGVALGGLGSCRRRWKLVSTRCGSKDLTVREIGRRLSAEGRTPPRGGAWQPSTLQRILTRDRAL